MKARRLATAAGALALCGAAAFAAGSPSSSGTAAAAATSSGSVGAPAPALIQRLMTPMSSVTHGTVTVEGRPIDYEAVAGTLVIHGAGTAETTPEAAMSYVAYFKQGAKPSDRPITFLYNGGPGSSSVWLLMGAFGPRRVVTRDHSHTPAAPYTLVNNDYSLLDASDLVFIDMPGTGFGRLLARGATTKARVADHQKLAKALWGVDGDAKAFARFINQFLTRYGRWNSPKYLYGESYGTTRSAVLANILEEKTGIDLNGVIMQSQLLDYCDSIDGPRGDPGINEPYVLALPTYAATAWYHHRLPKYDNAGLWPLLERVIHFAKTKYAPALFAGRTLSAARKYAIAAELHDFTGLPTGYWLKANLRVTGGMFEHELLNGSDATTGRLDTRFSGPAMNPTGEMSLYDPQGAAIGAAYISAFNEYVRKDLKFGQDLRYWPGAEASDFHWQLKHQVIGMTQANDGSCVLNVIPDLAAAMKYNPDLKVMVNGGFYDLSTPFYTAIYDIDQLPIPERLFKNIQFAFYPSGHMIYVHIPSLKKLHDNVARFIKASDGEGGA